MGALEFRCILDCGLLQHQHVDDFILHDHRWSVMVAGVDMRLAGLLYIRLLHCHDWADRSYVPHWFSNHWPCIFWNLGESVAGF